MIDRAPAVERRYAGIMQHHRKGLRAALATLGGIQSKLSASPALVASCVSLLGCKTTSRIIPVSPATLRQGTAEVEQQGTGHVIDDDGDSHDVSRETMLVGDHVDLSVGSLIDACRTPRDVSRPCLLDDQAVRWKLQTSDRVLDAQKITSWTMVGALTGALVLGNYECFGPGCGTAGQVAIGVTDGLVLLTTLAIVELARNWGTPSCGPLAPPVMPREELG